MSDFCIYEKTIAATYYDPPESWCTLDEDYECDYLCPFRLVQDDYDDIYIE